MAVHPPVVGGGRKLLAKTRSARGIAPAVRSTEDGGAELTVGSKLVRQPRWRLRDASEHLLLHPCRHCFTAVDGGGRHARKRAEPLVRGNVRGSAGAYQCECELSLPAERGNVQRCVPIPVLQIDDRPML